MASDSVITRLRALIAEPLQDVYTDQVLSDRIDADGDYRITASEIWAEKAASAASLADVQEAESSRKLSQLQSQALKMRAMILDDLAAEEVGPTATWPKTRPIERL